jgi:hypothetical protein
VVKYLVPAPDNSKWAVGMKAAGEFLLLSSLAEGIAFNDDKYASADKQRHRHFCERLWARFPKMAQEKLQSGKGASHIREHNGPPGPKDY